MQPVLEKDLVGNWRTIHPEIMEGFREDFWEAVEIIDSNPKKAEKVLKKVIYACGNAHIDAILHLGFLMNDTGRPLEGNALIHKAHKIALEALPGDFNPKEERIYWGDHDNRPLLRTFHAVGLEYMNENQHERAIEKFSFILNVNPGDNQGVRFLIPECLLFLGKYENLLLLSDRLNEFNSLEYLYAKVFAHFKLNNIEQARIALQNAKSQYPFVAEEIIKTKHIFPFDEFDIPLHGIPRHSRQEAFEYWNRTKELWEKEKDLKQLIFKS